MELTFQPGRQIIGINEKLSVVSAGGEKAIETMRSCNVIENAKEKGEGQ